MVEAIQQYGGCISTDVGQSSAAAMLVLVVTDMQTADLGKLPPNTIELHLTTVDHILVRITPSPSPPPLISGHFRLNVCTRS